MSKKIIYIFIFLFTICIYPVVSQSLKFVPLSDPVYGILNRGYAEGWLYYLPQIRPYNEKQVSRFLKIILNRIDEKKGSEYSLIRKKIRIFLKSINPGKRPLQSKWGENNSAAVNFKTDIISHLRLNSLPDTYVQAIINIEPEISLSQSLYMGAGFSFSGNFLHYNYLPFRKFFKPQAPDYPNYAFFLTRGISTFGFSPENYIPGESDIYIFNNTDSQISINFNYGTLTMGKKSLSWGPSSFSNLQLSRFAHSYDFIQLYFPLTGSGTFSWMLGFLQDKGPGSNNTRKMISAHRAEFQFFDWFMFAIYESVIYSYRFELSYLNPLSLYIVNEIRLGDQDNKLGGADFIFRLLNLKAYISFFADDWDMGAPLSFNYYHNEWGGIAGIQLYEIIPRLSLTFESIYLSHWLYTHRNDLADTASNFNRYTNFGTHLGHILEPNSIMFLLQTRYDINERLSTGSSCWFTMHGRTNVYSSPVWSEEQKLPTWPYYDFIDGVIESNCDFTIFLNYKLPAYKSEFHLEYSLEYTGNADNVQGENRWDHLISLKYTLKYF